MHIEPDKFLTNLVLPIVAKLGYVVTDLESLLESFPMDKLPAGVSQKQELYLWCKENGLKAEIDFRDGSALIKKL